jgi:hypothetical protein
MHWGERSPSCRRSEQATDCGHVGRAHMTTVASRFFSGGQENAATSSSAEAIDCGYAVGRMARMRRRVTYANVVGTLGLFFALGGGAYAAFKLPGNSVGTKH